jgi:hypothetical protein
VRDFVKDLLKLNKHSSTVFGVQEDNRVSVSSNLGLRVDGCDAAGLNLGESVLDVVDLQADVMHATTRVLHEIVSNGALLSEGLQ